MFSCSWDSSFRRFSTDVESSAVRNAWRGGANTFLDFLPLFLGGFEGRHDCEGIRTIGMKIDRQPNI